MKILALGNCCKKAKQNYENAVQAAKQCGLTDEVALVGDFKELMKLGVMSTPALMIDGKVVASGRALSVEQIVKLIEENRQ